MPVIKSTYTAPILLQNSHLLTSYPTLFRKVKLPTEYKRKRIELPDDDFIDIDTVHNGHDRVAILCHGLEGCSQTHYMRGMAKHLVENNWDVVCMNFRGCSGDPNRLRRSYHSGDTDDLRYVISYLEKIKNYTQISLLGFSLGGNLILKYLGENEIYPNITKAVAISVPCDLKGSAYKLTELQNKIYMRRFIKFLIQKIRLKNRILKTNFNEQSYSQMKTFAEFDDAYTAPEHGFKNAEDYWRQCSCRQFIPNIKIPTLLINSVDDPFLSESCYPISEAEDNKYFYLEMPKQGGHMGFVTFNSNKTYWHELRASEFLNN